MACVLQDWVCDLNFMQQSVLLTAIRGADTLPKYHVSKHLLRWLRRCIMYSAFDRAVLTDPHDLRGGNFTGPIPRDKTLADISKEYLHGVDEVPHHFHLHIVHAAEILGYKHPQPDTRMFWHEFYIAAVRDMHMHSESLAEMEYRLGDSQKQWMEVGGETLHGR